MPSHGDRRDTSAGPSVPDKPWTLKIEFTRGCNLSCGFCPIHALPEFSEHMQFIQPALVDAFTADYATFKPNTRIELTLRGEPTLNPFMLENLAIMRRNLPLAQVSMFTNGVTVLKEPSLLLQLLDAGVNILNIDCYNGTFDRFKKLAEINKGDAVLKDFREFTAYKRHPNGHRLKVINLVPDIADSGRLVVVRVLHNNGGNVDPTLLRVKYGVPEVQLPLAKKCARPFREFVLYNDGSVIMCCHDWKAESVIGKFPEQSVEQIWNGEPHMAILRALYAKDRSDAPCNRCDYKGGFRLGFLKDPT